MGTPAGFPAYRDLRINAALKEILDAWAAFLDRPDSLYVFNESPTGWKCAQARRAVVQNAGGLTASEALASGVTERAIHGRGMWRLSTSRRMVVDLGI
jgi:hypothetical protein